MLRFGFWFGPHWLARPINILGLYGNKWPESVNENVNKKSISIFVFFLGVVHSPIITIIINLNATNDNLTFSFLTIY
jgi:hypothetical protein